MLDMALKVSFNLWILPLLVTDMGSFVFNDLGTVVPRCPWWISSSSVQFSAVSQSCLTLWDTMNRSTPGLPVHHQLPQFTQTQVHWVGDAIQPSHLLSPPSSPASIFPSIRIFSNESVLYIRYPKYWSFSFSLSLSSDYSGLISFRIDCFNLLVVPGTLKSSPAPLF